MAIFVTHCAICGGKITADTPCLTTWGVVFPGNHRLLLPDVASLEAATRWTPNDRRN